MQIFKNIALIAILAGSGLVATAQKYKLPDAHNAAHSELIASQENISNQVKVENTQEFLDNLFKDEEEPEIDIYTEGWNSKRVNAYAGAVESRTEFFSILPKSRDPLQQR